MGACSSNAKIWGVDSYLEVVLEWLNYPRVQVSSPDLKLAARGY